MPSEYELALKQPWYSPLGRRLWLVFCAPAVAQILGSAFNIWYNFTYVQPLLSPAQLTAFLNTVLVFNAVIYPAGAMLWIWVIWSLRKPCQQLLRDQLVPPQPLLRARQRVINLPWWGVAIAGTPWLLCIPVFLLALSWTPDPLNPGLLFDLPTSFVIAGLIATTQSFFAIELVTQRLLYPILFQEERPFRTPGTLPLSLRSRSILLAFCGSICPIVSLLLLIAAPHTCSPEDAWFAVAVGGLGIAFSLTSAWMVEQLVIEPIKELKRVAVAVSDGDLKVRISSLRADEFGPLIDEINHMIGELQEKQLLQETFGRHVGEKAALQILQRDPGLGGIEQELTVMFADLRNFTRRCSTEPPQKTVALLNVFLSEMVEIVEQRYGGMVNKFLGDGFMALFGVGEHSGDHAVAAVSAAQDMRQSLQAINCNLESQGQTPLAMGIGIHTGRAVVGSIGSSRRLEYTAIGDTVNIAARVEALTKVVGAPVLLTDATQQVLPDTILTQQLPPQSVKGQPNPLTIYQLL